MTTPFNLSEEIVTYAKEHDLLRPDAFAGEPQIGLQLALARIADLVADSFAELAEQPSGREVLWNAAHEPADTPAVPTPAARNAPATASPRGAGLVKSVLDDRYHGTLHGIATAAGVSTATATRLLDVATTAAPDVLGYGATTRHASIAELGQLLRGRPATTASAPLASAASPLAQLDLIAATPVGPTASRALPPTPGVGGWFSTRSNVLLLAVSVIALAEFGYIISTRTGSTEEIAGAAGTAPAATAAAEAGSGAGQYTAIPVANLSTAPAGSARAKAAVPVVLKLKNGLRQIIGAQSTESKLYQFLADPSKEVDQIDPTKGWIGFDRIYFEPNKAILTNESLWQLSNVSLILKKFPAAKVKLGGYTDSTGQALTNLRLSKARAEAAMSTLVGLGVPADHLTAVGYGALDNIAPNNTEESRALNRRVSLQVTQK